MLLIITFTTNLAADSMACPFCALGCGNGRPTMEEITRTWRVLQLAAHPDQGGTTEAAAFLNTTKEYAIHCIRHPGRGKADTNSCRRHGCMSNEVPSPYPIYQPHSTTTASSRSPPPPPSQKKLIKVLKILNACPI